jgi:ABC-2 type transport system ATP-binding protein
VAKKSTTIIIMCGYLEPSSGDTIIDGISVSREPMQVKSLLGVVPQEIALYKDLNSMENVEFFGRDATPHQHGHCNHAQSQLPDDG